MKQIRLPIISFILTVSLAFCAFSEEADRRVSSVSIVNAGPGAIDEASIRSYIGVKEAAELDRIRISKDVKDLLDTGRFSDVKVTAYPEKEGVALVYSICNKWRLGEQVTVSDARGLHFSPSKIRKILEINTGDLIDEQVLNVKTRKLRDEYIKDYYNDIELEWKIIEINYDEGIANAELTVKEGKPAKVGLVQVAGNGSVTTKSLRKVLKQRSKLDPRWLFRKRRYSPDELEAERLKLRDYYLDKGFLDVVVEPAVVERSEDGKLLVTFKVAEGPVYRFGEISVEGIETFPEQEVRKRIILDKGEVASMSTMNMNSRSIRDFYGAVGYVDCSVRHVMDPDPAAGTVNINIDIREGELTKIRNIIVRGNVRTKDKVVRREVLVYPGEVLNSVKADKSKRRLQNMGYFETVSSYNELTSVPGLKDVVFEVKEKPTGNMMLGVGFSSVDSIIGFAELQQSNFDLFGWPHPTGGGQKLRLSAQSSSTREEYELSITEPWFLDRKLSLRWDLYSKKRDYDDYEIKRLGSAVSLTAPLPGYGNSLMFTYRLEKVNDISDTNVYYMVDTGEAVSFDEDERVDSSLTMTLGHDSRDNFFAPNRGIKASLFGSLYGGPVGFDTEIYNVGLKVYQYVPIWRKHVVLIKLRYEVVEEYGDTDQVPWSERLFIGGGRTLRGFDYRDVGPKAEREEAYEDDDDSDEDEEESDSEETTEEETYTVYKPYGGKSLAMGSVNYIIPIVKGLRIAAFYDIGNVWLDPYEFEADNMASSAGVGLRLDFPGFPISIDRAWVIEKDHPSTGEDDWVFWIGHDF